MVFQVTTSSPSSQWVRGQSVESSSLDDVSVKTDGVITSNFKGFGGCFNELGWKALAHLDENERGEVLGALFSEAGCAFNYCRLPIGANDYAESWYSHNETEGDFAMEAHSIARDHRHLIPLYQGSARRARQRLPPLRIAVESAHLDEISAGP